MTGEIIGIISAVVAVIALLLTLWQSVLTRRALESQVLLSLKEFSQSVRFFDGVSLILSLKEYRSFDEYAKDESEEYQMIIYNTVDFLNFVAHLVEEKHIQRQTAWNFYFHAYRISSNKLMPWWVEGIRKNGFQRFTAFEKMCKIVNSISPDAIISHEAKHQNTL